MLDFFIICALVTGLCAGFILGGLAVMAYIYVTHGKKAAIEFFEREF